MIDLSVCLPTYDRVGFACWTARLAGRLLRRHPDLTFEIVVSDNRSPGVRPDTWQALIRQEPLARVVSPPEHVPTAEENLRYALSHCRGRYVWVLGDDDDPLEAGVERLVALVRADQVGVAVFNSRSHSFEGFRLRYSRIPCNAICWDGPLIEFVRRTGFWFVLAGFSSLLLRTPQERLALFDRALSVSKIYSHVGWVVSAYHAEPFRFENTPLISYRQNLTDVRPSTHWQSVAAREGTFFKGLWTNQFLRLVDLMIASGACDGSFPATVVDRHVGERFVFVNEVLRHFIEQLALEHIVGRDRQFDAEAFDYFVSWAPSLFPDSLAIITALERARNEHDTDGVASADSVEDLWALLRDRWAPLWIYQFFVRQMGPYELFRQGDLCWAVRVDRVSACVEALNAFDLQELGTDLIVAPTLSALADRVDQAILMLSRDEQASAWSRPETHGTPRESFEAMIARLGGQVLQDRDDDGEPTYAILPVETSDCAARAERPASSLSRLEADVASRDAEIARLEGELGALRQAHRQVLASTSWKMTSPVRRALSLGRDR